MAINLKHTSTSEDFMTSAELAEYLSVTKHCLRRWRHQGKSPPFVKVGWFVRYGRKAVERWLDNHVKRRPKR